MYSLSGTIISELFEFNPLTMYLDVATQQYTIETPCHNYNHTPCCHICTRLKGLSLRGNNTTLFKCTRLTNKCEGVNTHEIAASNCDSFLDVHVGLGFAMFKVKAENRFQLHVCFFQQ